MCSLSRNADKLSGARKSVCSGKHCWHCGYYPTDDDEGETLRTDWRYNVTSTTEKHICHPCWNETKGLKLCMMCGDQSAHGEDLHDYDFYEDMDTKQIDRYICTSCVQKQEEGTCAHLDEFTLHYFSSIAARCNAPAVYTNPLCCGHRDRSNQCSKCGEWCCPHENHPSGLTKIPALNQSLCRSCLVPYKEKQAKKDAKRAVDDAEYWADQWAQERTLDEKNVGIRDTCIKV